MSAPVQKRINALRNLQLKIVDAETNLFDEINKIEAKYQKVFQPLYDQREKIVNGEYEPSEAETKWDYPTADDADSSAEVNGNATKKLKKDDSSSSSASDKGIPDFWLTTIKNSSVCGSLVREFDEPVLKHLRDIKVKLNEGKPYGYTLEFHFNDNPYFSNKLLTKHYELIVEKDDQNPLLYNTNTLYKCIGCKIEWNEGKDVTKKNQEEGKMSSFFHLFDNHTPDGIRPSLKEGAQKGCDKKCDHGEHEHDNENAEVEFMFDLDYEVGQSFKDSLVPKAVLYFTGDIEDEAMHDMDDDEDEESDDDDDEDDEEEEEEPQPKLVAKKTRKN